MRIICICMIRHINVYIYIYIYLFYSYTCMCIPLGFTPQIQTQSIQIYTNPYICFFLLIFIYDCKGGA